MKCASSVTCTWTGDITVGVSGAIIQADPSSTFTITGNVNVVSYLLTFQGASTNTNIVTGLVSGTGGVKKSGTGTWAFSNANTYSGGMLFHNGTLGIHNAQALGTDTLVITQGNPGNTLSLSNTSGADITHANILVRINNNFRYVGTNNLNLGAGNVSLTADVACNVLTNYTLTIDGVVSGAFAFTKNGAGTLEFNGANTYTGATTINNGILQISNAQGTGTTAGGVNVASGGTLALTGGISVGAEAL